MSSKHGSLYDLLRVRSDATEAEIKEAYRAAVLETHPDKAVTGSVEGFRAVQAAWEVLRDPARRAAYNRRAAASHLRTGGAIAEELDLDDFVCSAVPNRGDSHGNECAADSTDASQQLHCFEHPCRCGGAYIIDEDELPEEADAVLIQCCTCSLVVRLSYSLSPA